MVIVPARKSIGVMRLIDRCDALGLCQREEWISHQILRVARRQIARQRAKQVELSTF